MPRKHHREPPPPPLQVDPAHIPVATRLETKEERNRRIEAEFGRKRERNDRRVDARVAKALDWDTCCIPGCETSLRASAIEAIARIGRPNRDVSQRLPLCRRHETIVYNQCSASMPDPVYLEVRERLARQRIEKQIKLEEHWDLVDESGGAKEGQIYFARVGDMVKVGWSSKLRSRLKNYGASAEILCHYPASRDDETLLHRQLRPYLVKGREWYQDCPLIHDVVAGIVERHGPPTILPRWTEPKPDPIKRRRSA